MSAYSQCCSQGVPMAGDANVGVLGKSKMRIASFYRYSYSAKDEKRGGSSIIKDANYNFIGTTVAYGLFENLTIEFTFGYFLNKTQNFEYGTMVDTINGFGLSNGNVTIKNVLYKNEDKELEITGGLGLKFPFSSELQKVNGVELPIDNLPSTYAFGVSPQLFVFKKFSDKNVASALMFRYDKNFKNKKEYEFGQTFITRFLISKQASFISDNSIFIFQIRDEIRGKDTKNTGENVASTGSHLFFFIPQFSQNFGNINASISSDLPLFQKYSSTKLANKFAVNFNLIINL